jgi:hypothetical protein
VQNLKQPALKNLATGQTTDLRPAASGQKPFLRPAIVAVLALALFLTIFQIFLVYSLVIKFNNDPATDFNLFFRFARAVLDGQSPYQLYQPTQKVFQGDLRFVYFYWVIFIYLPFARLESGLAFNLWATLNLLLLLGAVWLGWRTYLANWRAGWLLPLYCLALAVCTNSIINGHATVIMLLGFAACAYLYKQGRFFVAGLPALVFLIKPQITFFAGAAILALALYRVFKARGISHKFASWPPLLKWLAGAAASSLAISAFSLLLEPDWPWRLAGAFNTQQINGQVQPDGTYLEFFKAIFPSWLEFLTGWQQPWLALVSGAVVGALVVWGGVRLWQGRDNFPVFLATGLALTLAVTFYSHVYDFPLLVPALFVILGQVRQDWQTGRTRAALLRAGCLALLFVLQPSSADYRWFYSQPFIITLLALTIPPARAETFEASANNRSQPAEI